MAFKLKPEKDFFHELRKELLNRFSLYICDVIVNNRETIIGYKGNELDACVKARIENFIVSEKVKYEEYKKSHKKLMNKLSKIERPFELYIKHRAPGRYGHEVKRP